MVELELKPIMNETGQISKNFMPDHNKQLTIGQCGVLVTVENYSGYTSSGGILTHSWLTFK